MTRYSERRTKGPEKSEQKLYAMRSVYGQISTCNPGPIIDQSRPPAKIKPTPRLVTLVNSSLPLVKNQVYPM
ncbi:Uncharacterized protein HZ326_30966 [Fusarium oxysporum f. sp. albedinis]|nr:Uncharacterized protein HZ326_30966 [Fusarium oxysporum f. sp. albedinis]